MQQFARLRQRLGRIADVQAAQAVLSWDQETYMPTGGGDARAHQLATLGRIGHEMLTDDEIGALLESAAVEVASLDPDSDEARIVQVTRRDRDKAVRVPASLVAELARTTALAQQAWAQARGRDDFASFRPHLERVLELTVQKAEALGYDECPYDALLDEYEPDMKASEVSAVFTHLRGELVPMVEAIAERPSFVIEPPASRKNTVSQD